MKNKGIKKVIAGALMTVSMIALNPMGANAAWRLDNTGWWYTEGRTWATGWREINNKWYYFMPDTGYMAEQTTIDGYYVGEDGAWIDDSNFKVGAAKAERLAKYKLENSYGGSTEFIKCCGLQGSKWVIHCYNVNRQDVPNRTVSLAWYYVDKNTGVVTSMD